MHPFECQWTGQALTTDVTHLSDHTENHRWQGSVGSWMVVFARAIPQCRTPEGSHIHRNGPVTFMAMHLPAGQPFDLLLPQTQDNGGLPGATPESSPSSTGSLLG
jgi:hypothetical protein